MSLKKHSFSANGKFLITGEYAVLDNIPALALPLQKQQHLEIEYLDTDQIQWESYDGDGNLWFKWEASLDILINDKVLSDPVASKLVEVLKLAKDLSPDHDWSRGFKATMTLDFNRKYGMGTSSTLIALVAQWMQCDPYELQFSCFGGSGYDIACATAKKGLIYNYNDGQPTVDDLNFNPDFKDHIFFVYLNQKQNSRDSIASFNKNKITPSVRKELSNMPAQFASANRSTFELLMTRHEQIIASLVDLTPVKDRLFKDYPHAIKSLGGWGGDFIMVIGSKNDQDYFRNKGFDVIYAWDEVILNGP